MCVMRSTFVCACMLLVDFCYSSGSLQVSAADMDMVRWPGRTHRYVKVARGPNPGVNRKQLYIRGRVLLAAQERLQLSLCCSMKGPLCSPLSGRVLSCNREMP